MLIKICGITNKEDATAAAALGVDMLGFIFYAKSKRYVRPSDAAAIIGGLPPGVGAVGVFVDEDPAEVTRVIREAGLAAVQFHGAEPPDYCAQFAGAATVIKAVRIASVKDVKAASGYPVDYYLFDTLVEGTPGGTGTAFDWSVVRGRRIDRPVILSGGLTPESVGRAIRELAPAGVDVSTGVERAPGLKDARLMERFVVNVRERE